MKLTLLLCALSLNAQVAKDANATYQTAEGRKNMAKTLADVHRDARQKPAELVAALGIKHGMSVADVGTGVGYMLPFLSAAAGNSKVYAEDIFDDFLAAAKARAEEHKLKNVTFIKGGERDPMLPENCCDLVLVLDVYHHFDYPEQMLAGLAKGIKKGGRLAIVDYYRRKGAMPGTDSSRALTHIRLDAADAAKEIETLGPFKLISVNPFLPGTQYVAMFERQ